MKRLDQAIIVMLSCLTCTALLAKSAGSGSSGEVGGGRKGGWVTPVPDSVKAQYEIHYADPANAELTVNLYLPKVSKGNKPLPVLVHPNLTGPAQFLPLVASGDYAAVSINCRLVWPSLIHDHKAAIRWVRANAAEYHLDPDHIGAIGGAWDGHVVAMLGVTNDNKELEGDIGPYRNTSSSVQCVVDVAGPTNFLSAGSDTIKRYESMLIGGTPRGHKDLARAASPLTYVSAKAAPMLIFHRVDDPLVPYAESQRFSAAMKRAGAECLFITVQGGGEVVSSREINRRIRQFFDHHLRGMSETISTAPIRIGQ